MKYFVTAIGTDCGKTLVSAIITEMLEADYWKPVQAGYPRDTDTVQQLISNEISVFHPERFLLETPASPHASAKIDGVKISLEDFQLPITNRDLVIEGAGGVLVPLNDQDCVIDLAERFKSEIILVSNFYLGSINHTLLTAELLKKRELSVKGIVFNGPMNERSEAIILKMSGLKKLLHIEQELEITQNTIKKYAKELKACWD